MNNQQALLDELADKIADLVSAFERESDARVTHLELDNRMRGTGGCCQHHINLTADFD